MNTAPLEIPRTCPRCSCTIPADQSECSCVTRPRYLWLHSRETRPLLTFADLIMAFIVTGSVSASTTFAAADFETALIYAREDMSDEQIQLF